MADNPPALEQHHRDVGANFVRIESFQTNMDERFQAIITVLPLIKPAICPAMFARAVAGQLLAVLAKRK
jgi:hypothetical protein